MLRFLLWRLLGLLAAVLAGASLVWLLGGGPGRVLRGQGGARGGRPPGPTVASSLARAPGAIWSGLPIDGVPLARLLLAAAAAAALLLVASRWRARARRRYVRLRVEPYRADHASVEALISVFEALHKRTLPRWWRRLVAGAPTVSLEFHYTAASTEEAQRGRTPEPRGSYGRRWPGHVTGQQAPCAWLAVTCVSGAEPVVEAALRSAYPNCSVASPPVALEVPPALIRLKKQAHFITRVSSHGRFERERQPSVNRLLTTMATCGPPALVQLALTPAPLALERFARSMYRRAELDAGGGRLARAPAAGGSRLRDAELQGGLDLQHRPLFFVDIRILGPTRVACEQVASQLRSEGAENQLVERGTWVRHRVLGLYDRRVRRGEGSPLPSLRKSAFAPSELAALWQIPASDYLTVPLARASVPLAPAPPAIMRPAKGEGTLRDSLGPVSIHPQLRRQNTAVPGTVEQGKSSYLVATVAEDLRRERCAVIVLDPKGDAADAALSCVPPQRACTLLDFARPTCGFNPLAVDAPADVIADYVVGALRNLFTDADIRASSDRYLRNAIIAVLAYDRSSTMWDAARLLSVGEEGYAYRRSVASRVRALPEYKEISAFFTAELTAQLADARSVTTSKLDAPVNKLARLLNSASIKRVLLNDSLLVDFDRVIATEEVLIVKGALGAMGAGNTSVLMQLLIGMLDAALARQQDLVPDSARVAVALKVDEAPLVINRGFAETIALKRSAGLETVACWQSDAQWTDRDVRDQLDALFAHRVYFATGSAREARASVGITMAEFSDTVRPRIEHLSALGRPDARLHLPKHHAIASWITHEGRQAPFLGRTVPLSVDRERLMRHAAEQRARGGRHLSDFRQPHWDPAQRAPRGDGGGTQEPPRLQLLPLPASTAESYRELVELDRAQSVRWGGRVRVVRAIEPDGLDLEILALIVRLGHVLTSQIHRHFNPARAITTTQRRLKRLSDAGLLERFQFHRRDGGGVPMCYVAADAGLHSLRAAGSLPADGEATSDLASSSSRLRRARRDVHAAGWALALTRALADRRVVLRGGAESALTPPTHTDGGRTLALGPSHLRLPGGRIPHDFLSTDGTGRRSEVERFDTLRPQLVIEVGAANTAAGERAEQRAQAVREPRAGTAEGAGSHSTIDVMVEIDDRLPTGRAVGKLERYEHFLAGWSAHTARYGRRMEAVPLVVFVCRDRARARRCAQCADPLLRACRAYPGEYPHDWLYTGRSRILFASERDAHEGVLYAMGVPSLPPDVRVTAAGGDPRAGSVQTCVREIVEADHDRPRGPSLDGGR
ncbi:MAG: hypothetical protein E6G34_03010 [Actinobacteria bacterium]|nr:MAG: hypothetical protein E6G34_03010 [Actinomycetota bacterium]